MSDETHDLEEFMQLSVREILGGARKGRLQRGKNDEREDEDDGFSHDD